MNTCNYIVGYTKEEKPQPLVCGRVVRYEGSFVCKDHVWMPKKSNGRIKRTVPEMQEVLLRFRHTQPPEPLPF